MWGGLGSKSGAVGMAGSSSALAPNTGAATTSTLSSSSFLAVGGGAFFRRLVVDVVVVAARRRLGVAVVGVMDGGVVVVGRGAVAGTVGERQWRHFFADPDESSPVPHHACKCP